MSPLWASQHILTRLLNADRLAQKEPQNATTSRFSGNPVMTVHFELTKIQYKQRRVDWVEGNVYGTLEKRCGKDFQIPSSSINTCKIAPRAGPWWRGHRSLVAKQRYKYLPSPPGDMRGDFRELYCSDVLGKLH